MISKAAHIALILFVFLAAAAYAGPSRLTVAELKSMVENKEPVTMIDVRTLEEYNQGHIPGAVPIESIKDLKAFKYEGRVVLYCNTGRRSQTALRLFKDNGIEAADLEGGIKAWKEAGGNVVAGPFRDVADYPRAFEIPKGVCEPGEPSMEIGR